MTDQGDSGDALTNGDAPIFPPTTYEASAPPVRTFAPWHKPRKQLVRKHQWLQQTERLLQSLPSNATVKYLGLPGVDLLDLRALHKMVCPQREFLFLGFTTNNSDGSQVLLEISLQEVKGLSNVQDQSRVVTDDISSLARANSVGNRTATDLGPFDIVNLDFCDNLLASPIGDMSVYNAIAGLFGLQNRRKEPWLLFITTRVDRATMDPQVQERLDELLANNHADCEPFAAAIADLQVDSGVAPALGTCSDGEWVDMFCVALSKWMLIAATQQRTGLEVKSTMSYRVKTDQGADDLVSIAYLLTPSLSAGEDATGLADSSPLPDECVLASRLPGQAKRRASIDTQLANDPELMEQMTSETVELLVEARYREDDYRAWLAQVSS